MALLFMDGFDHYAAAGGAALVALGKWNGGYSWSPRVESTGGMRNTGVMYCPYTSNAAQIYTALGSAPTTLIIGFAFKVSGYPTAANGGVVCSLQFSGANQCELKMDTSGRLYVARNGTLLTDGKMSGTFGTNAWRYVEWKVTIADSIAADSCIVKIDNVQVINVAAGQDTKNSASAGANEFNLGQNASMGTGLNVTWSYDDLYVCDNSGSTNNDFLGGARIDTIYPDSAGTYTDGTPSAGSNYQCVDETPQTTTDYVDFAASGNKDSYNCGSLPSIGTATIYAAQVAAYMQKDDAGARSGATFMRSGTTDSEGTSTAMPTTAAYLTKIYETDPNTAAAWTETNINAVEIGAKCTA